MRSIEGKTEKSSGFLIYIDVIIIVKEREIESDSNISRIKDGTGSIITPMTDTISIAINTSSLFRSRAKKFMLPLFQN